MHAPAAPSLQKHSLDQMTAAWLLPVLPGIVCAASGEHRMLAVSPPRSDRPRRCRLLCLP